MEQIFDWFFCNDSVSRNNSAPSWKPVELVKKIEDGK